MKKKIEIIINDGSTGVLTEPEDEKEIIIQALVQVIRGVHDFMDDGIAEFGGQLPDGFTNIDAIVYDYVDEEATE